MAKERSLADFNTFNTSNMEDHQVPRGVPSVNSNKIGAFGFSKAGWKLLENKAAKVEFHQSKNDPLEWYVSAPVSEEAFEGKVRNETFTFHCSSLRKKLASSMGIVKSVNFSIRISDEPLIVEGHKLYPLITKATIAKAIQDGNAIGKP